MKRKIIDYEVKGHLTFIGPNLPRPNLPRPNLPGPNLPLVVLC